MKLKEEFVHSDSVPANPVAQNTRTCEPCCALVGRAAWRCMVRMAAICLFTWLHTAHAGAQYEDRFEGGKPRWLLVESDCNAQISNQEITPSLPQSGQACESFELFCTNGSYAHLAIPIEPCAVIDELQPSLWVQCSSANLRLGVSVIFPHAKVESGRLQTILWGSVYNDPGHWQRLSIEACAQALSQEMLLLRQRYANVVLDGAYIDAIVLNGYTSPGRVRIKVDEMSLPGAIAISSLNTPVPVDWKARWRWRDGAGTEENRWLQMSSNRLPVWWQYRGESLPFLRSLGFQGILLDRVPGVAMLEEARNARLLVISPPPTQVVTTDNNLYEGVRGWLVGAAVDARAMPALREEVNRVALFPQSLQRQTIAEAMEQYWAFSRVVDELIVPAPPSVSAGTPADKQAWLRVNLASSKRTGTGWVSIMTDPLPSWLEQVRAAQQIVEPNVPELDTTDAVALRLQVAKSVAAGARGFLFRSNDPLDENLENRPVRVAAMRSINRDLALISPWITSGQIAPSIPKLDRDDFAAAAWTTARSHLIMFVSHSDSGAHSVPPTRDRPLRATMPLPTGIHHVLRLTAGSAQSLLLKPGPDGMTWEIPEPGPVELCVLTDNPLVETYISGMLAQTGTEAAVDMLEIANHQLRLAASATQARWPQFDDELPRRYMSTIQAAQQRVEQGYGQLRANRPSLALEAASQAYDAAQMIIDETYRTAISNLAAPQSSPLVLANATLPMHWQLARACEQSQWRSVPLPAAEFSDLNTMLQAGWSQQRRLTERADMLVELVPASETAATNSLTALSENANRSTPGLRLAALPKQGQNLPGGYEGTSIRVRSAPGLVAQGELVRISAQARIRRASVEPGAGLLVYENKGGPAIGHLVRGQVGQTVPIELYRFNTDDQPLRILTELRGACDIVLENVSLSAIRPAVNVRAFPTNPIPQVTAP